MFYVLNEWNETDAFCNITAYLSSNGYVITLVSEPQPWPEKRLSHPARRHTATEGSSIKITCRMENFYRVVCGL